MMKAEAINILLAAGYSKTGAEDVLQLGTIIVEEENLDDFLEYWNDDREELITADDIKAGKADDIECVEYNGKNYVMFVAR